MSTDKSRLTPLTRAQVLSSRRTAYIGLGIFGLMFLFNFVIHIATVSPTDLTTFGKKEIDNLPWSYYVLDTGQYSISEIPYKTSVSNSSFPVLRTYFQYFVLSFVNADGQTIYMGAKIRSDKAEQILAGERPMLYGMISDIEPGAEEAMKQVGYGSEVLRKSFNDGNETVGTMLLGATVSLIIAVLSFALIVYIKQKPLSSYNIIDEEDHR